MGGGVMKGGTDGEGWREERMEVVVEGGNEGGRGEGL